MFQHLIDFLQGIGIFGVYFVMFLEGASVPFPGIFIIISYGYILKLSMTETAFQAGIMAVIYTAASFIPYFLALKLHGRIPPKLQKGIHMGRQMFNRFGAWSIAITRPFGIGNYISYVAGFSNVPKLKYGILTFIGIYPWAFAVLFLGKSYELFLKKIGNMFQTDPKLMTATGLGILLLICLAVIGRFLVGKVKMGRKANH
ncbi:hypothetical protein BpJC7_10710 [Weizmannia acidilactici]|uniref:VTT domain-containing protein n=1 Tax=Weizmannia acidilactici TaxID=2607726 RepID=A0A5J4JHA7_9BACI|nr:VTT domain-containing protein [Weizmannia acidilactici]GER69768.1 hypothetical protein BpJC7_10710 [Weizmannia acidilactici]GER73197.1 hypothetical protein BpPP18_12640 [Weizmannia acidilactici]